jgi:hypothetical protein
MKLAMTLVLAAWMSPAASASDFTCEKIKEKPVRISCIKDRDASAKKKLEDEAQETAALAATSARRAELEEFAAKAKALLTQSYKDPQGAQFRDLVVAESAASRTLCGSVNGRNSYGGYVGFKKFYVQYWTDPRIKLPPMIWNEGEFTRGGTGPSTPEMIASSLKLESLERDAFKLICSPSSTTTVAPLT